MSDVATVLQFKINLFNFYHWFT